MEHVPEPFCVETVREEFTHRGYSRMYGVVSLKGVILSWSFRERDDAQYWCDELNNAYKMGWVSAQSSAS